MAGRLSFSQFNNVKTVYTKGLSTHLEALRSGSASRYIGIDLFHATLAKFGIEKVFADPSSKLLLDKDRLIKKFSNACYVVPEFSRAHSNEQLEQNKHLLMSALNSVFGRKGIKVVLSNDCPEIYFLKDETNLDLFIKIGSAVAIYRDKPDIPLWHPKIDTLLAPKKDREVVTHLKECDECRNVIISSQTSQISKPKIRS